MGAGGETISEEHAESHDMEASIYGGMLFNRAIALTDSHLIHN